MRFSLSSIGFYAVIDERRGLTMACSGRHYAAALVAILMLMAPQNVVHAQAAAHSHDANDSAPDYHKVLLENESVRVLETRIAPGERTPAHAHQWPAALYVLSLERICG